MDISLTARPTPFSITTTTTTQKKQTTQNRRTGLQDLPNFQHTPSAKAQQLQIKQKQQQQQQQQRQKLQSSQGKKTSNTIKAYPGTLKTRKEFLVKIYKDDEEEVEQKEDNLEIGRKNSIGVTTKHSEMHSVNRTASDRDANVIIDPQGEMIHSDKENMKQENQDSKLNTKYDAKCQTTEEYLQNDPDIEYMPPNTLDILRKTFGLNAAEVLLTQGIIGEEIFDDGYTWDIEGMYRSCLQPYHSNEDLIQDMHNYEQVLQREVSEAKYEAPPSEAFEVEDDHVSTCSEVVVSEVPEVELFDVPDLQIATA